MKTPRERLTERMRLTRCHSPLTITLPDDVIEALKEVAPSLGFGDHLALARTYIGRGLRDDVERLDEAPVMRLTESLREKGMSDEVIAEILTTSRLKVA